MQDFTVFVQYHTLDGKKILNINRAALKILGYESQEELAAGGFDLVAASIVVNAVPKTPPVSSSFRRTETFSTSRSTAKTRLNITVIAPFSSISKRERPGSFWTILAFYTVQSLRFTIC